MRGRAALVIVAVATSILGVAVALVPGLAGAIGTPPVPVSLLGAFGVVLAAVAARRRTTREREVADLPMVESARSAPRPGADFDDHLATAAAAIRREVPRRHVRERVRAAAIDVLVATEGVTEGAAAALLESGEWTQDPYAASLFADDVAPPLRAVVYGVLGDESAFERQVRRAVGELHARLEEP